MYTVCPGADLMSLDNNIRIVLVSPLYGGNVGSVCRAMANMGFSDLALVTPGRLDMNEASMMACHADAILEGRREFGSLPEAVADCGAVFGTSARGGLYRAHARTPRAWATRALQVAAGGRAALVFGRKTRGSRTTNWRPAPMSCKSRPRRGTVR